jgi:hypothetical protein
LEHQEEVVYLEALHRQVEVAYLQVGVVALHLRVVVAYFQVGGVASHQVGVALHHREEEEA